MHNMVATARVTILLVSRKVYLTGWSYSYAGDSGCCCLALILTPFVGWNFDWSAQTFCSFVPGPVPYIQAISFIFPCNKVELCSTHLHICIWDCKPYSFTRAPFHTASAPCVWLLSSSACVRLLSSFLLLQVPGSFPHCICTSLSRG